MFKFDSKSKFLLNPTVEDIQTSVHLVVEVEDNHGVEVALKVVEVFEKMMKRPIQNQTKEEVQMAKMVEILDWEVEAKMEEVVSEEQQVGLSPNQTHCQH